MQVDPARIQDFKILIVEDDQASLDLMVVYLSDAFPHLVTASDGEAALAAAAEHRPDLILLDIMLPKVDGYEVCRRLRADPATAGASIIMVTGLHGVAEIERAVQAGTDDFLTKPISRTELMLRVRSILHLRFLRRELDATLAMMDHLTIGDDVNVDVDVDEAEGEGESDPS